MLGVAVRAFKATQALQNSSPPTTKQSNSFARLTRAGFALWSRTIREAKTTRSSRNLHATNGESGLTASRSISAICVSYSSTGRTRSGPLSVGGAPDGQKRHARRTMRCRSCLASPLTLCRWARSPATLARASSISTTMTARRLSGLTPTLLTSRELVRLRSRTPST